MENFQNFKDLDTIDYYMLSINITKFFY